MRVTKTGAEWYGRKVVISDAVLYWWILFAVSNPAQAHLLYASAFCIPESPYQPLYCLYSRHEPQLSSNQAQEGVDLLIQLRIFGGGHLGSVFILTLLAEERCAVRRKTGIQVAQILEALVAYGVDCLVTLASGDLVFEDQ